MWSVPEIFKEMPVMTLEEATMVRDIAVLIFCVFALIALRVWRMGGPPEQGGAA